LRDFPGAHQFCSTDLLHGRQTGSGSQRKPSGKARQALAVRRRAVCKEVERPKGHERTVYGIYYVIFLRLLVLWTKETVTSEYPSYSWNYAGYFHTGFLKNSTM
jgi:hypothetical protein